MREGLYAFAAIVLITGGAVSFYAITFAAILNTLEAYKAITQARAAIIAFSTGPKDVSRTRLEQLLTYQNHPIAGRYARKTLQELNRYLPEHMK